MNVEEWNMCQQIYKYGLWCDADCRALDYFRTDKWSVADIVLLSVMCILLTGMMFFNVTKRYKQQQYARKFGDPESVTLSLPGLPPFPMAVIFLSALTTMITMAKLKFVNETLVFSVVACLLLLIYTLKLTVFETRDPVKLAAPRHDMMDHRLDDHLFE